MTSGNGLSVGFVKGLPDSPDYFYFAFDILDSVQGPGEFAVHEIRWDNGTVSHTVEGGLEVQVPNRFVGPGTATVTEYDQMVGKRRVAGTVEGRLQKPRVGTVVDVRAHFDIHLPCGAFR